MIFDITWSVDEAEWQTAREKQDHPDYVEGILSRIDSLDGQIQISANRNLLFPSKLLRDWEENLRAQLVRLGDSRASDSINIIGVEVSLVDFAFQLDEILRRNRLVDGQAGDSDFFAALDSGLEIHFTTTNRAIEVTSNAGGRRYECRLVVAQQEFVDGAYRFLADFVHAVEQRVPGALNWAAFASLRKYQQQ